VLIPYFGATGAAIATSSSLLCINLTASLLLSQQTGITPHNLKLLAVACGFAVSVAVGLAVHSVPMENVLRIALVGAVTVTVCTALSYLLSSRSERRAIKTAVGSRLTTLAFHHLFHPTT
jgi:O-antigen/teichoic acid export membrane protein